MGDYSNEKTHLETFNGFILIVSMLTMDFGTPLFAVTDDTGLSEDTAYDDAVSDSTSEEADLAADSEENTPVTT